MEHIAQKDDKAFLDIRDLVVEYHTDDAVIHAVNGVSLTLNKGETLGLVGETGAGKTSIARSILRILPDPPAKVMGGEIWFDDVLVRRDGLFVPEALWALNPQHLI